MDPDREKMVEELFQLAADLPPDQRSSYLSNECADGELRCEVEQLLSHFEKAEGVFLEQPPLVLDTAIGESRSLPETIGNYRLIRRIGEGGMGVVYEAEQQHPRRRVALKLIRGAYFSKSLQKRFEQETIVLGRLKHPGIAQIYEAGTAQTAYGEQPFFAMEFVEGPALLEYVSQSKLGTRDRLDLTARICQAVHYAHQKGVIHRDLKPGNILVEPDGQPKILDFGVARLTGSDVHLVTTLTEVGQLVGTLSYMSPEQVGGRSHDVDARSDVYALGVILFELLGQSLPYDLSGLSIIEAGRIIHDQEPTRLGSINAKLRGEIEIVVAKALEKDRNRRYASAADLAADIRRFLHDEPILARPASTFYQLRKFTKRNKAIVAGVTIAFVALGLGLVGTTLSLLRANDAEHLAVQRLQEGQRESAKAAAVNRFLGDMLSSVDPDNALGREITVRQVLDEAAKTLETGPLHSQPEVEAELRNTIANTYKSLGHYDSAEEQISRALELRRQSVGPTHLDTGRTLTDFSSLLTDRARYADSEKAARESLEILRQAHVGNHEDIALALRALGSALMRQSKYHEAEDHYRESLSMLRQLYGEDHLQVAIAMNNLGLIRQYRGDLKSAEGYFRGALEIRRKRFTDHPDIAGTLNNLAFLVNANGDAAVAESLYREALEMRSRLFGNEHPHVAQSLQNLAVQLHAQYRFEDAEPLYKEALSIYQKRVGDKHPDSARVLMNLGVLCGDQGRYVEAEALQREALGLFQSALVEDDSIIADSLSGLGTTLCNLGRFDEAEPMLRESLAIREKRLQADHPAIHVARNILGFAMVGLGRFDEGRRLLLDSYEKIKDRPQVTPKRKREMIDRIARALDMMGETESAAQWRSKLEHSGRSTGSYQNGPQRNSLD